MKLHHTLIAAAAIIAAASNESVNAVRDDMARAKQIAFADMKTE